MKLFQESAARVFGLLLICLIPTLLIYLLLGELVSAAELSGKALGYTIEMGGPVAFYGFLVVLFRSWATREATKLLPMEVDQEEIDQMTEDEKTRRLYEIDAEITILQRKRTLVAAATAPAAAGEPAPPAVAPASLTPFQVDAANIQGL